MFGGGRQWLTRKIKQKRPGVKRDALRKNPRSWPESRQEEKIPWLENR
jgi:hypothetical protein